MERLKGCAMLLLTPIIGVATFVFGCFWIVAKWIGIGKEKS